MKCSGNLEDGKIAPSKSHKGLHEDGLYVVLKDEGICQVPFSPKET